MFRVEDKLSGNHWVVAYYTDNPVADAKECKVGSMICIKNGMPKQFADGQYGFRIEDSSNVLVRRVGCSICLTKMLTNNYFQILPCGLAKLRQLNAELHKRSDDGLLSTCVGCNAHIGTGCGKCKTRYCSKVGDVIYASVQAPQLSILPRNVRELIGLSTSRYARY